MSGICKAYSCRFLLLVFNPLKRISQNTGSHFQKCMVSIKTTLVRKVLGLQDYTYYHYTHRKIPVLMVLIIEACKAICLRLKREFSIRFHEFDCTWAQKRP